MDVHNRGPPAPCPVFHVPQVDTVTIQRGFLVFLSRVRYRDDAIHDREDWNLTREVFKLHAAYMNIARSRHLDIGQEERRIHLDRAVAILHDKIEQAKRRNQVVKTSWLIFGPLYLVLLVFMPMIWKYKAQRN